MEPPCPPLPGTKLSGDESVMRTGILWMVVFGSVFLVERALLANVARSLAGGEGDVIIINNDKSRGSINCNNSSRRRRHRSVGG